MFTIRNSPSALPPHRPGTTVRLSTGLKLFFFLFPDLKFENYCLLTSLNFSTRSWKIIIYLLLYFFSTWILWDNSIFRVCHLFVTYFHRLILTCNDDCMSSQNDRFYGWGSFCDGYWYFTCSLCLFVKYTCGLILTGVDNYKRVVCQKKKLCGFWF